MAARRSQGYTFEFTPVERVPDKMHGGLYRSIVETFLMGAVDIVKVEVPGKTSNQLMQGLRLVSTSEPFKVVQRGSDVFLTKIKDS